MITIIYEKHKNEKLCQLKLKGKVEKLKPLKWLERDAKLKG